MSNCAHRHPNLWWMESRYPVRNTSVADCLDPEMAKQLQNEIFHYRSNTFSENTKATHRTHQNSYLHFCQHMGYPLPCQLNQHIFASMLRSQLDPLKLHPFLITGLSLIKISSCRVNTTSRRGIKWLGISLGTIFLLFFNKSSRGPLS